MGLAPKLNTQPLMDTDERLNPNSAFKNGIDRQREIYKFANLESKFDAMAKALENIKIEIKDKAHKKNLHAKIKKAEKFLQWYGQLELKSTTVGPDGQSVLNLPLDIEYKCSRYLNRCYEILMEILGILDLV